MLKTQTLLDEKCINTIRFLSIDAIEKAKSGHPGAPLGMASFAYVLWNKFLKHNPHNPKWFNRDRFILSAGHASALLYSLLHLTGYPISIEDLKNFRQWGSKTPGHPEYGLTEGVETTTGPLGQGFATGVGMAMAEKWLSSHFNRDGFPIVDHFTYAIVSDGDLEEGISSEAASLAGTLQLGKLIYLYDDNGIQIEGSTKTNFREDVKARFISYGWQVIGPIDGFNLKEVEKAIKEAQEEKVKPSLIICKTIIGYGSPKQNTASVHGSPLGEEATLKTKEYFGWKYPPFYVPEDVLHHTRQAIDRGKTLEENWKETLEKYKEKYSSLYKEFIRRISGELPKDWEKGLDELIENSSPMATRVASGKVLNFIAKRIPELFGGSADLAPSNKTLIEGEEDFSPENHKGRNIHFGVREHALGAILNGLALHGGIIPYGGTFLVFSDYMRPAIRLASMMKLKVIYIFTHDSIGLGEDGPTHQPVEHLMSLRAIPNLTVIRPTDAEEVINAWKYALQHKGPVALILTRQKVNPIHPPKDTSKGGYIIWQGNYDEEPDIIIISTGSEVSIALEGAKKLHENGVNPRVVAIPSWEIFDSQDEEYRNFVLPPHIDKRISVEAGITLGWEHYVGLKGIKIGLNHFGASAPYKVLYEKFGITADHIVKKAQKLL